MRIHNFGSLNIDDVFSLPHIVRAGETSTSTAFQRFEGGKGLNQSLALARAGAQVCHYGRIAENGRFLLDLLESESVDTSGIAIGQEPTGHAIIQVAENGENAIVLYGGANQTLDHSDIERLLAKAQAGDLLLVQNEVSAVPECMQAAKQHGLRIAFNPSPFTDSILQYPLELIDWLIVNEIEAATLAQQYNFSQSTQGQVKPSYSVHFADVYANGIPPTPLQESEAQLLRVLQQRLPKSTIVLTLGARGAVQVRESKATHAQFPAPSAVLDTTGAGDTFSGYYLHSALTGATAQETLNRACAAAAISVTRKGAGISIPNYEEVQSLLKRSACAKIL